MRKGTTLDLEDKKQTEADLREILVKEGFDDFQVAFGKGNGGEAGDVFIVIG